jgi:YVTN family beta-propeller protein
VGSWSRDARLSNDGKTLYIIGAQTDGLSVMDMANRQVIRTIRVGIAPHAVVIDGKTGKALGKTGPK